MSDPTEKSLSAEWLARLKIGAVAACLGGGVTFAERVWTKFDVVNTAMAQTEAKANSAIDRTTRVEVRLDTVDSGMRQDIQRLERKIDANNEQTAKDRAADRELLQTVLREVKKR